MLSERCVGKYMSLVSELKLDSAVVVLLLMYVQCFGHRQLLIHDEFCVYFCVVGRLFFISVQPVACIVAVSVLSLT